MRMKGLIMGVLLACTSPLLMAADYYVDVTNRTGYTIFYLYVSPGSAKTWEEDVLGSDVIMNGDTTRVTLTGYTNPYFDIQAVDEDGDSYTFWNVNVAEQDLVITLDHLD
ncbi:hypothetical protein LLY24_09955 [Halomonas sp. wenzhen-202101]|uniref:Argininosuccinate lyase n=2 Tax=Halomonas dongshanensis TaxID=2890835 RepID=A0ABT2EDI8_9GAMM|nr:hypothetical protein [Halomonas dongshanensis]MCS2609638.1 hypothetical protein [Halomonas dongshanensis]